MKAIWKKACAAFLAFTLVAGIPAGTLAFAQGSALDEGIYDEMRLKWEATLTGGDGLDREDPIVKERLRSITETAQGHWSSMLLDADRARLWPDLDLSAVTPHEQYSLINTSYTRLQDMALAYRVGEDDLRGNANLRDDILGGMAWLYTNYFNETVEQYGNWYQWQIGIPQNVNNILTLMYDDLPDGMVDGYMRAIDHFPPTFAMTGANRVWVCTVNAMRGVLGKNSDKIAKARDDLSPVLAYVTSGDGFYRDGSFIQHNYFAYNGGYGAGLFSSIASLMHLLADSPWALNDANRDNIFNWAYDSFEPFFHKGDFMDMMRGRNISRQTSSSFDTGREVISGIIRLSQFAPPEDAAYFKSLAKYLITENTTEKTFYKGAKLEMLTLANEIVKDESILPRAEYNHFRLFPNMDRAVVHRSDFAFGISMHSSRMYNYEKINGENIRGWHTGDGMTYLYNGDLDQFSDHFWPTVNASRLPGTTVLNGVPKVETEKKNQNAFVGGSAVGGQYGAVAMWLQPFGQTLSAQKSWFVFDDEIVALGAGISAQDGGAVETTVENRMLNAAGNNAFTVDGQQKSTALGWEESLNEISWAHLQGETADASIGYYFPQGASLKALREARTGSWSEINKLQNHSDPTPRTRNYLTLWFDHGVTPQNASYSYVLLPGKSSDDVAAYSASPDVQILADSALVHAARDTALGVTAANFWSDGDTTVRETVGGAVQDFLTSNSKASVTVAETDDTIEIAVSDPTMLKKGLIGLEVNRSASQVLACDPRISVIHTGPTIRLVADVTGLKGESLSVRLQKGAPEAEPVQAPHFTSEDSFFLQGTEAGSCLLSASGSNPIVYGVSADAPQGIRVDRFGILTVDTSVRGGTYHFTVTAENAIGRAEQPFTLTVRRSDLIADWRFEEGSGSTFTDSTGKNRTTEVINGATWAEGKNGLALRFPTPNPTGNVPVAVAHHLSDLSFTSRMEIEFDVNFDQSPLSRGQRLIEKRPVSGYTPYGVRVSKEGKIGFQWNNIWYESEALSWETGVWYRIYILHDGHKITFRRDEVECGIVPNADVATGVNSNFAISPGSRGNNDYFLGRIDNLTLSLPVEKDGLRFTSASEYLLDAGQTGTFQVSAANPDAPDAGPVRYSLAGEVPAGLEIDANGLLHFPALSDGLYTFLIIASYDEKPDAVQRFMLTVQGGVPQAPAPAGTILYWNFNEGSGTLVRDRSANAIDGKFVGNVTWVEDGFVGPCLQFGAASQKLESARNPAAIRNVTKSMEFDFWVNFNVNPLNRMQVFFRHVNEGGTPPFSARVNSNGAIGMAWGGKWSESDPLTDWKTGEWYHINIVLDGSTVTFRRDGLVVGQATNSGSKVGSAGQFGINAGNATNANNFFSGKIDEFWMGKIGAAEGIHLRHKVRFATDEGETLAPAYVYDGKPVQKPADPQKDGSQFAGWYADKACTIPYDFNSPVEADTTLYAKWTAFVPVTSITDIPQTMTVGDQLTLTGVVQPQNATETGITWALKSAGTTEATLAGNTLTAADGGTVVLTATIAGGGVGGVNYTQDVSILVERRKIELPAAKDDLVYNGAEQTAVVSGEGYTVEAGAAKDAGSYVATVTPSRGYAWSSGDDPTGARQIPFAISRKPLTVTADDKEKFFGQNDPALTYSAPGLVAGDALAGSLSYTGSLPGTYDIVAAEPFANPNYEVTFVGGTMTIKMPPDVDAISAAIRALPDEILTHADADQVASAVLGFEALPDDQQALIGQELQERLAAACQSAGQVNRKVEGAELAAGLPWQVRLVLTPIDVQDPAYQALQAALPQKILLKAFHLGLIDTLTGTPYALPDGQELDLSLLAVTLPNGMENAQIYLQTAAGETTLCATQIGDASISFRLAGTGLYGLAATESSVEPDPGQDPDPKPDPDPDPGADPSAPVAPEGTDPQAPDKSPETPEIPAMGQGSAFAFWLWAGLLSLAALCGFGFLRRKHARH